MGGGGGGETCGLVTCTASSRHVIDLHQRTPGAGLDTYQWEKAKFRE